MEAHNKDNITSDTEFLNSDSMTLAEVQHYLEMSASYLATYSTRDVDGVIRSAAEIIYNASQNYFNYELLPAKINPQVILTKLQVEQQLITTTGTPSKRQLRLAMGYLLKGVTGFAEQVDRAVWQFRKNWGRISASGSAFGWGVGIRTQSCDFINVTPENIATSDLYAYTPNVGVQWGGRYPDCNQEGEAGGNFLYYDVFYNRFGFGGGQTTLRIASLTPLGLQTKDWDQMLNYTINVTDGQGNSVSGATVRVTDSLEGLSTLTQLTNGNGQTSYTTTVPSGKPDGVYDVTFTVSKPGFVNSPPTTRQIQVSHSTPALTIASVVPITIAATTGSRIARPT